MVNLMDNAPDLKSLAEQVLAAVKSDDSAHLRVLLKQGAPPDGWWDPIEAAARSRQMNELIKQHALPVDLSGLPDDLKEELEAMMAERCYDECTGPYSHEIPLHVAAESGAVDCIHALLEAGADINKRDSSGATALFCASAPRVVSALIQAGINVHAVTTHDYDAFKDRLSQATEPDDDPSHIEADLAVCKAMLDAGMPLIVPGRRSSRLYDAAFAEHLQGVKLLLNVGHPIDADTGHNALHAICWHWDYSGPRDVNTREIVRTLLKAGFDPNSRGDGGATPLHEALSGDGSNLVAAEELLAAGADINATNYDGQTPLHLTYETLSEYERVVPFMLDRGANPLLRDRWGQSVIDIARRMIAGENPRWRIEQYEPEGGPPCGWKTPAKPGDSEYQMLELLEEAATRFD